MWGKEAREENKPNTILDRAAVAYDEAIAARSDEASYYTARAANSLKRKKYSDALSDTDKSIELKPGVSIGDNSKI